MRYFAESVSGKRSDIETKTYEMNVADVAPLIRVRDGDSQPEQYHAALDVTLEAVDDRDEHVTVHYTRDGSIPDEHAPSFRDQKQFDLKAGNHVIACYAKDSDENETYEIFHYSVRE